MIEDKDQAMRQPHPFVAFLRGPLLPGCPPNILGTLNLKCLQQALISRSVTQRVLNREHLLLRELSSSIIFPIECTVFTMLYEHTPQLQLRLLELVIVNQHPASLPYSIPHLCWQPLHPSFASSANPARQLTAPLFLSNPGRPSGTNDESVRVSG